MAKATKGRWQSKGKGTTTAPDRPRPAVALEVALPGLEQVRDAKLDGLCKSLAEEREVQNQSRTVEARLKGEALKRMHAKDRITYRGAGVELVRHIGDESLTVKLAKGESGTTGTTDAPTEAGAGA